MTTVDDRPTDQQAEKTTADLLIEHDQTRARSLQRELGWSDVGVCRKRAGYWLAGVEPTDPGGSLPAVMGTAIHESAAKARAAARPRALIEYEVRFAGILGHLDWYEDAELGDLKTVKDRDLERLMVEGPSTQQLWQINGYAAGMIRAGFKVNRLVLDFVARDTGRDWQWIGRPDPQAVQDALAWVKAVRDAPLDMLGRDHAPTSEYCKGCPFRTACWDGAVPDRDPRSVIHIENPGTAALWAEAWTKAVDDRRDAEKREDEAKGVLDALRPNTTGRSDVVDIGLDDVGLRWSVSHPRKLDHDQVRADYRDAGIDPPTKRSTQVRMTLAPLPKLGEAS